MRRNAQIEHGRHAQVAEVADHRDGPLRARGGVFRSARSRLPHAASHAGQIWRYDPQAECVELVAFFPTGCPFDGPDNITAGPHGFAIACTDGEVDNWLVAIGNDGGISPFAFNAMNDVEFAGATFSPDGQTLFANIQEPGLTLAIWGPWESGCR